eukprot:1476396-Prorocentrum_lima.AAC.1
MTSSLVGSEMCIRDRQILDPMVTGFSVAGKAWSGCSARDTTASDGPVSYTHLTLPTICSV